MLIDRNIPGDGYGRVLEVAKRLGYRKNNAAASLRSGRSHTIALLIPDIANPFYSDICRYLENVAYKAGYTVLFASSDESWQKLGNLIDTQAANLSWTRRSGTISP